VETQSHSAHFLSKYRNMNNIELHLENIKPRLLIGIEVVKSFFTRTNKTGSGRCLPVKAFRQWTGYSCCASVLQMVADYYGNSVSHLRAIKLTGCRPDGASLTHVARVLRREYGLHPKHLKSKAQIRAAIQRGEPVIANDFISYLNNHAILLVGETPKGFWVADPVVGQIRWRHERQMMAGADEWIAVAA
jgi:ABC-type bacteriocin/lantibiotic exporter with double-glycine peptidase domain